MKSYQDPNHHLNGSVYHTGKKCIERDCEKPAGTAWSVHWCQSCNAARVDRIGKSLLVMTDQMNVEAA